MPSCCCNAYTIQARHAVFLVSMTQLNTKSGTRPLCLLFQCNTPERLSLRLGSNRNSPGCAKDRPMPKKK